MTGLAVALIQTRTPATAQAGLAHLEPLIRQAAEEGAKFVLTPEGSNFLEQRRDRRGLALTDEEQDAAVLGLRRLAAELGVWLLIGSAIVRSGHQGDDRAANRSLLIDAGGGIVVRYDKLHVFYVDLPGGETYRERSSIRAMARWWRGRPGAGWASASATISASPTCIASWPRPGPA